MEPDDYTSLHELGALYCRETVKHFIQLKCVPDEAPKRFIVNELNETLDELRKQILREIHQFKFKPIKVKACQNVFFFNMDSIFEPEQDDKDCKVSPDINNLVNNPSNLSLVLLEMRPQSWLKQKNSMDLTFIVLNNFVNIRCNSNSKEVLEVIGSQLVFVPNNKQFILANNDVNSSFVLMATALRRIIKK